MVDSAKFFLWLKKSRAASRIFVEPQRHMLNTWEKICTLAV
jgi:hypothetical protein